MSWEVWGEPPEPYCEVCGEIATDCICPECPVCGVVGDPACYPAHGLELTDDQIRSKWRNSPEEGPLDPSDW